MIAKGLASLLLIIFSIGLIMSNFATLHARVFVIFGREYPRKSTLARLVYGLTVFSVLALIAIGVIALLLVALFGLPW